MNNLDGKEDNDAELGGVVRGENEVGDAGGKHSNKQEMVSRRSVNDINKTEDNTAEFDNGEEVIGSGHQKIKTDNK